MPHLLRMTRKTLFVISTEQRERRNLARCVSEDQRLCRVRNGFCVLCKIPRLTLGMTGGRTPLFRRLCRHLPPRGKARIEPCSKQLLRPIQDPSTTARDDKENISFQRSFDARGLCPRLLRMTKGACRARRPYPFHPERSGGGIAKAAQSNGSLKIIPSLSFRPREGAAATDRVEKSCAFAYL